MIKQFQDLILIGFTTADLSVPGSNGYKVVLNFFTNL